MHLCTPPHTKLSFSHTLDVHREFVTHHFYSFIVFYYCLLDNDNYDNEKFKLTNFFSFMRFHKNEKCVFAEIFFEFAPWILRDHRVFL